MLFHVYGAYTPLCDCVYDSAVEISSKGSFNVDVAAPISHAVVMFYTYVQIAFHILSKVV